MRHWMDAEGELWTRPGNEDVDWAIEVIPVVVHSREWAVVMRMRGEEVDYGSSPLTNGPWEVQDIAKSCSSNGWYVLPPKPPSPPPLRRGERVRGERDGVEWTGPYWGPAYEGGHHIGKSAAGALWVPTVERIEGGAG